MQSHDVEGLVEEVAAVLGRGLSLEDVDGLLLAYSSNQPHADKVRVNFLLSKRVPADVSAWQLAHGIAVAVRPVALPANEQLGTELLFQLLKLFTDARLTGVQTLGSGRNIEPTVRDGE